MDRLNQALDEAREGLSPHWNEERGARLFAATERLRRRRTARRRVLAAVASCAAAALLTVGGMRGLFTDRPPLLARSQGRNGSNTATPAIEIGLRLADGSRAETVGAQSRLEATHDSPERIELKLIAGRAHFDVVPNPLRSFTVEAASYRVQVIGTVFDVERTEGDIGVVVTRGKVRVSGPSGTVDVHAGESRRFALHATAAASDGTPAANRVGASDARKTAAHAAAERDALAPDEVKLHARSHAPRHEAVPASGWRSLSRSGQYEAAFESLRQSGTVDDDPAALMDAADAARLSGHPENAVGYLTRVARRHGKSPLAPLAAFTLGRVYLEELGQPDQAADAFGLARQLAPSGSMAQDSLAREVESLSKAGNARRAFVRAREYIQRYPAGRRLRAVQLYGGIE